MTEGRGVFFRELVRKIFFMFNSKLELIINSIIPIVTMIDPMELEKGFNLLQFRANIWELLKYDLENVRRESDMSQELIDEYQEMLKIGKK